MGLMDKIISKKAILWLVYYVIIPVLFGLYLVFILKASLVITLVMAFVFLLLWSLAAYGLYNTIENT